LGGVSNCLHNFTPARRRAKLGTVDQAYKELELFRQAGGQQTNCEGEFITYSWHRTRKIPSKIKYTIHGNDVVEWIRDGNPDKYNESKIYNEWNN